MQTPYLTIPEMVTLLDNRGYNEKDLSLEGGPKTVENLLKRGRRDVRASLTGSVLDDLFVELKGHFDGRRDELTFNFHFYYSSEADKLKLSSVRTTMGEDSLVSLYARSDQLTPSKEIYAHFTKEREKEVIRQYPQIIRQPTFQRARHL